MGTNHARIQDWVIDSDTHITEPGDLWTSRLPARFKDRAPHLVRDPESGVETNVREKIDNALGHATPEARHKVLFQNAAELYKIEPPDTAPPVPVG